MPSYDAQGDGCLSLFADIYETGALRFPPHARVLEIGCAEIDWMSPMGTLRPDLAFTGIDWRDTPWRPGRIIKGDVLTQAWPSESFDVVVGISSIEHIGLGHYDADPLDVDGDRHCMERVVRWLAPGGWVYLDVPYAPEGYRVHGTEYRLYDARALRDRLCPAGLTRARTWYSAGGIVSDQPPTRPDQGVLYAACCFNKD